MKIFRFGRQINGRFDSFTSWLKRFTFKSSVVIMAVWFVVASFQVFTGSHADAVGGVITVDSFSDRVEGLQDELVNEIARLENESNIPIVFDDNKAGTLSKKDKASIGCMQFKISTVQRYSKELHNKVLTDLEAVLLALDCEQAKVLAQEIIFETKGGLWNWAVATKEMGVKVGVIKELMK